MLQDPACRELNAVHPIRHLVRGPVALELLAGYPPDAKPNLVPTWLARWIDLKRREARGGSLSPLYAKELDHLARPGGDSSYLDPYSIHQVTYGVLEDWSLWLADRRLSPKSRRNLLGYMGAFLRWLERRSEIHKAPRVGLAGTQTGCS